jgi:catechol 2,3-dioxygenase-like lactoylglutathione lyase family enzyme
VVAAVFEQEWVMFDHVGFAVSNLKTSKFFYDEALKPLGISIMFELTPEMTGDPDSHYGYGAERPQFWIGPGPKPPSSVHVAFAAKTRKLVDEFYKAALAVGGTDNGAPGLRPHYHEHYYGAFVRDPDGNNIEAVCHTPE